jgi:hypothetical protein
MPNKDSIKSTYDSNGVWYVTKNLKVNSKNYTSYEDFESEILSLHSQEVSK